MNFLAPLFLIGGLAIAGPIIFHLIRRTTREHTLFSSLMFLLPTPPRLTRRSRLENWLLLLLRCLALGLLAIGFARPFMKQSSPNDASGGLSKRLVVLLDVSASMRRAGLFAEARTRAGATLRTAVWCRPTSAANSRRVFIQHLVWIEVRRRGLEQPTTPHRLKCGTSID